MMTQTISAAQPRTVQRKHQPTLGELVFLPTFILLVAIHCLENTSLNHYQPDWMPAVYLYRNLLYGVLLVKIVFLSVYREKELWAVLGALLVAALSYKYARDLQMVEWVTIVVAAKDVPRQKLLYTFLLVKSISIALTLLLHEVGVFPTLYYLNGSGPIYNTMGFCHRNVLGANISVLCLGWFYLRFRQIETMDVLFWVVLSAVTYFLAISRTSLIIMLMIIVVMCVFHKLEPQLSKPSPSRWIFTTAFGALFLICLICTIFYDKDSSMWTLLDSLFTKRLTFSNRVLEEFGLSLFGQDLPFVTTLTSQTSDAQPLILDNSYMRALLYFGIVPGLLFLGLYVLVIWRSCQKGRVSLVACLMVMAVFGISESYMLDVFYNFPLLLGLVGLFRRPSREEAKLPLPYALSVLRTCWDWIRDRLPVRAGG